MGQLEVHGINEIYLSGIMVGLLGTYFAEEFDSNSFESYKAYFYSVAFSFSSKKIKKIDLSSQIVFNNEAAYNSKSFLDLNPKLNITKTIYNVQLWQDPSLVNFKVDSQTFKLQQRYNW